MSIETADHLDEASVVIRQPAKIVIHQNNETHKYFLSACSNQSVDMRTAPHASSTEFLIAIYQKTSMNKKCLLR